MAETSDKANFGVGGLDDITVGGLARGRWHGFLIRLPSRRAAKEILQTPPKLLTP